MCAAATGQAQSNGYPPAWCLPTDRIRDAWLRAMPKASFHPDTPRPSFTAADLRCSCGRARS